MLFVVQAGGVDPSFKQITIHHDGHNLHGYVLNPDQPHAIIYYGGNAEQAIDNLHLYNGIFPDKSVYLLDYRGYGLSEGNPTETGLFSDALYIYEEIEKKHQRVSIIGRSLGTGIAVYVASKKDAFKLVLLTPYDSISNVARKRYFLFPVGLLIKDPFESWRYAPAVKAKTLVLKAETDRIVPHSHTDALISYFDKKILSVAIINDSTHITIANHPDYTLRLMDFFSDR